MKKTKLFILLVLSFSLSLQAFRVYQSSKKETMPYTFSPKSSYEKEWRRVDSLQQKGLTKSALEVVAAIYSKSKSEKNTSHFIRAIIEKMKLESYVEEDSYIKAIGDLEKDAATTSFPIKNIIHSVAAETYWKYYQNNRYNFLNRTETVNFENSDIHTWDLKKLLEKVSLNYQLSLQDAQKLKQETLTNYDGILIKGAGSDNLRPTLFDFLGHRAVDFFKDEEPELTKPAYAFELDKVSYFSNHSSFKNLALSSPDSAALKLWALKLLQQLILFHSSDKNPQALIDADIKRLQFVKQYSTLPEKDSLYIQALVSLEKEFSTSPFSAEVGYLIASHYWEKSNANTEQRAELKKLAFQKCNAVIAAFPAEQSAINCTYLKSLISEKSLSITVEDALLPGVANLVYVKYKNVKKVYFKVVKLGDSNEFDLDRGISNEIQRALLTKKGEANWSMELPDDRDFMEHGVQVKLSALNKGHYILFAGSDATFSSSNEGMAHTNFWITTISYITQRNTDGSYDGYTLDRKTGMPIKNVRIQLWGENYEYSSRKYNFIKGASFTSNEKGFFNIPFVDNNRNFYIEFTGAEQDRLCSDYGFYQYRNNEGAESGYRQTLFFTDRKIYRPGQTVFFKGILLEKFGNETKILPKQTTEVIFYDVNGQKISSLNLTSNAYGTVNGSFVTPQGLLNGQMQITDGNGSTYFSVEEYKRPKFEVIFDPLTGSYLLGDSVVISGKAQAYSGAIVDGAQVKYRVVREAIFPYWWGYWRSNVPNSPAMEISNGVVTTNNEGAYTIRFKSIPDLKLEKNNSTSFNYTVYVDVVDINGETHSGSKSVRIGYTKLTLATNIPKTLDKNDNQKFKISSSNLNGDYVKAQGVLKVYRLKQPSRIYRERKWPKPDRFVMSQSEFELLYENDIYDDENNKYKWEKEEKVAEYTFNTDTSLSKKAGDLNFENMKRWKQGEYMWIASTTDKDQPEITSQDYFTLASTEEKTIPTSSFNYFTMLVSKGEPGEIAKALIGTKEKNVQVLFEIERENEITKSEWLLLNEEQKIIEIPIEEKDRGNFAVHFTFVKNNRAYKNDATIIVPYTNKELDIAFETFRNKLYPGQAEEWRIKIKDKKGAKVAAELLATLYDASLDAFAPNEWLMNLYQNYYSKISWEVNNSFKVNSAGAYGKDWNTYGYPHYRTYDELNWFGFEGNSYFGYGRGGRGGMVLEDSYSAAPMTMQADDGGMDKAMPRSSAERKEESAKSTVVDQAASGSKNVSQSLDKDKSQASGGPTQIRKNFNETAFFFPAIETNEQGELIIKFTIPEALTKWKMLGLAHTKDLQVGSIEKELVTQKDLMVSMNAPRFFREGDKITLLAKVTNLSDKNLSGMGQLQLFNSITMQEITKDLIPKNKSVSFDVAKAQSKSLSWDLEIPFGIEAITYRVKAQSDAFSDGEEMTVPVLTNRMLVTESLPLPMRGNEAKKFTFNKLLSQNEHSKTLSNYKVTLEFTSNPAWYAIQALPYLMEYPYACAEQTFSRYYANSIATHVANSSPKIKAVFDAWKSNVTPNNKESLLSNLEKNTELKSLMLEETPWVMQAKNESERKQRVGLLFDLNKMSFELDNSFKQLLKMQTPNGGWPWFEGMPDDAFITQHIVTGMGHLDKLGVKNIRQDKACFDMIRKAVLYMDDRMRENYEWLVKHQGINLKSNQLNYNSIQYLYARSYFKDIDMAKKNQVAFDYYKAQSEKYWLSQSRYMQGMIALALNRYNNKLIAMDIVKSLKENSISSEELGMYWKENANGFYWYQAPIETQALLIEAFDEVAKDIKSVESMKIWLLKNKQTNDWKTTKATSEACYALLLRGNDWLATEPNVEINIGEKIVNPLKNPDLKTEAGTGYFKTSWNGEEITPSMGTILVSPLKKSGEEEKVMWGAVYWQYFENLDKITSHETPLRLTKKIFLEKNSATGPVITPVDSASNLKIGDKLKIRIELRVDRAMEYVQMKDMRSSGLEPVNVISTYKYQNGLGYYESTKDAATNFFFSYLPKGTYVFEYPLRVSHSGNFSNGITSIQCMYAPEFGSHSEGVRLEVKK